MSDCSNSRRQFTAGAIALPLLGFATRAGALTETDAAAGVRATLDRASDAAVALLGRQDGFYGNPKVRIGLPSSLDAAAKLMKATGQGRQVDDLVLAINRAAEAAVAQARDLLRDAVRSMSVEDALQIVRGGETSVTEFFARKTRQPLTERFRPIVTDVTRRQSLAEKYNAVAGRAAGFGRLKPSDASLEDHVTAKALDGLYATIGEEERRIRRDPVGTGSELLKRVFGR